MLEIRNRATTDIELDGIIIPYGKKIRLESINDKARMGSLVSRGQISVVYVNDKPNKVEDVKKQPKKEPIEPKEADVVTIENSESVEKVSTDTSTTRKKKSKDNNSEVENSKSTKGDMNNATD